jgi:hypothetical protein
MSTVYHCDVCEFEIRRVDSQNTCHKCSGIENQFNKYVTGKLAELQKKLQEEKLEWMQKHGAKHLSIKERSPGEEDAASPPRRVKNPPSNSSGDQPSS